MAEQQRPVPAQPPDGFEYVAVSSGGNWRVTADPDRRCRWGAGYHRRACAAPVAAELRRSHGSGHQWWGYCANHLYGNWIEDGLVMHWRLREKDASDG